ncbi:MAG: hypothetical protein QXZ44_01525 [Ferroplasma sp.]
MEKKLSIFILLIVEIIIDFSLSIFHYTEIFPELIIPDIVLSVFSIFIAGDVFLNVSYRAGNRLKLSQKSIGLFIVGFAAIVDEIVMSGMAAFDHLGTISFGVIQGSNVITLLGFFIIMPVFYRSGISGFKFDSAILIATSIIIFVFSLYYIRVPYYVGLATLAPFIIYIVKKWKDNKTETIEEERQYPYYYGIITVVLIMFASYNMINSALVASEKLHITAFISSFFLLGFFGSVPELIMMSISLKHKREDVSIGLITGSTVYKESILFSIIAFTGTLSMAGSRFSIVLMIIFSFILLAYGIIFR